VLAVNTGCNSLEPETAPWAFQTMHKPESFWSAVASVRRHMSNCALRLVTFP